MNTGMKMLMINNARRDGYETENRRFGGMENDMEVESRRRRDSRGRFRSEMDGGMDTEMRHDSREMAVYPNRPFPVYEEKGGKSIPIGFSSGGNEVETNYRMTATHRNGNEMEYRSSPTMGGYSESKGVPLTREMAEEWVNNMRNEDGTKGAHWSMEQVKQVMAQKGIDYNPVEMWAILNALYSDYSSVLKKWNMAKLDFFVDLACAWLNDTDAVPNKAAAYYEYVVKH